mmetsp:Transcript_8637/g.16346  ORF Transcript_8637/g.16346 Transcript_8637/m.16346 type:complete len:212 (-) Transcript_8637:130-765(-)
MGGSMSLDACCSRNGALQSCGRNAAAASPGCMRAAQRACGGEPVQLPAACMLNARLLRGAQDGDPVVVREALDAGAFTETRQPMRIRPGSHGGSDGNHGRGDGTRSRTMAGLTPLMHAAGGGHLSCVIALLEARARVDAEDEDGATPLHFAAASGDIDVFKAMLLAGADGSVQDSDERRVLEYLPEDIQLDSTKFPKWEAALRDELTFIEQ